MRSGEGEFVFELVESKKGGEDVERFQTGGRV